MKTNYLIVAALFTVIVVTACKTKKEINGATPAATETPATTAPASPQADHTSPQIEKGKLDTLFASIEQTPCHGTCPTFRFNIYSTGYAEYEGIRFTERDGWFKTWISSDHMEEIQEMAQRIGYFKMNERYEDPFITDFPSTITAYKLDDRYKQVVNVHHETPEALKQFEKLLLHVMNQSEFIPLDVKDH